MSCCNECAQGKPCAGEAKPANPCPPGYALTYSTLHGSICMPMLGASPAVAACPGMRWDPVRADKVIKAHVERGQDDTDTLAFTVLERLYPTTPDGTQIPWDTLPVDASPCLIELRRLSLAHAQMHAAIRAYKNQLARYDAAGHAMGRSRKGAAGR